MTRLLKYIRAAKPHISNQLVLYSLLFLTSCNVYYDLFYADPKKCLEECDKKEPYDVIIVPGFPHDSGKVNMMLDQRIKWAYFLYKKGYTKNIIFSGGAVHSPYVEAKIMKMFALQLGIKEENIFMETKSEHTTENMYFSYIMAQELGFKTVAFATEPAHASFMKPFKRKFKLDIDFLPIISDSLNSIDVNLKPIDESPAFIPDFVPLKKREGFFENLRGTRGAKVKKAIRHSKKQKRKEKQSKK